jgi:hypothetical protein
MLVPIWVCMAWQTGTHRQTTLSPILLQVAVQ